MDIGKAFDRYSLQARIMPVLLAVFPLASLVVVWLPDEAIGKRLFSGLVALVLLSLVAQLGRDAGRQREPRLFQKWNGKPSIRKLRHRDSDLHWITLERLRSRLTAEVGIPCPTKADEESNPAAADEVYGAYVDHLREATRHDKILLTENISYGFRRNLWGMRSAGLVCATIGLVGAAIAMSLQWMTSEMVVPAVVTAINGTLAVLWCLRINESWVKAAAESYADRLVRAYLIDPALKAEKAA
ncbi:MAG: hypothetical protein ACTHK7_09560 [Aureliella sp.]